MTVESWLERSTADAERRQLPELRGLLEALARSTTILRAADWNDNPAGDAPEASPDGG